MAKIFVVGGAGKFSTDLDVFDFATSTWSHSPNPSAPRSHLGAAMLSSVLYAIGGFDDNTDSPMATVDAYSIHANRWTPAAPLTTPREKPGICAFSGKIYAVGGKTNDSLLPNTVETFDPHSNRWTVSLKMTTGREGFGLCSLGDCLYAVGGCVDGGGCTNSAERFEPKTGKWTPIASMNTPRTQLAVATVNDKIYAIGGVAIVQGGSKKQLSTVEAYDAKMNSWNRVADMSTLRHGAGAVAHDGRVFVVGGRSHAEFFDSIEVYNPAVNSWSILPQRMRSPRYYGGVVLLPHA